MSKSSEINKVAKGQRKERMCELELQAKGYITWKTVRHKFINIDLFATFDVLGLAPDGDHLLFIQVKSERADNAMRDKIRNLKLPASCRKELWIWKARKGWVKEYYE